MYLVIYPASCCYCTDAVAAEHRILVSAYIITYLFSSLFTLLAADILLLLLVLKMEF
jgi:hypothetical protein